MIQDLTAVIGQIDTQWWSEIDDIERAKWAAWWFAKNEREPEKKPDLSPAEPPRKVNAKMWRKPK